MTVEYFDQWGMETHEWQFKRKYWLFGPWVGYLNGEGRGEIPIALAEVPFGEVRSV